jgi:hypothetical protein
VFSIEECDLEWHTACSPETVNEQSQPHPKQFTSDPAPIVPDSMARQQQRGLSTPKLEPVIDRRSTLVEFGGETLDWEPPSRWWGINE